MIFTTKKISDFFIISINRNSRRDEIRDEDNEMQS